MRFISLAQLQSITSAGEQIESVAQFLAENIPQTIQEKEIAPIFQQEHEGDDAEASEYEQS